jgi:hypothetical protein
MPLPQPNDGAVAPHTASMAPNLSSFPVFTSDTERVQWYLDPFSECGLDFAESQLGNRKPIDYTTLPTIPLAVGNGDNQVRLRETDEFRRACVVTGCDTRRTDVAENHLTCKPASRSACCRVRGRSIGTLSRTTMVKTPSI